MPAALQPGAEFDVSLMAVTVTLAVPPLATLTLTQVLYPPAPPEAYARRKMSGNFALVVARSKLRPILPRERLVVGRVDHAGRFFPQQHERPRDGRHVDWLPVAVEYQDWIRKAAAHGNTFQLII